MIDFDRYDTLITSVYEAGMARTPLARAFDLLRKALDASGAGVSVYDLAGTTITHTLVRSDRSLTPAIKAQLLDMNMDPSAGVVTGARLAAPRRFTDIVPEPQLRQARWFREQSQLTGMGHGIVVDVAIAGARIRLFAVRNAGEPNFTDAETEFLARVALHLERAFAHSVTLLSPFASLRGVNLILFDENKLAPVFVRGGAFDRQFATQYGLTPAEQRVLKVMADGLTRHDAHLLLGIGPNSIKTHMRRIYAKTGAKRLPQLLLLIERARGAVAPLP